MIKKIILFILIFSVNKSFAQEPIREFRGAWIATVANIDWPSSSKLSSEEQKQEIIHLFDVIKSCNLNAVIVQIRPSADVFYSSKFESWSKYLTGNSGIPPNPYYDPLTFMIEEAHKRCLEFHAWFNPYRALTNSAKNDHPQNHITKTHPEWFLNYGGKKYFDPGLPEVENYFSKIINEVVKNYDIDAIHMDDYFYPYREGKIEFPDFNSYVRYGKNFSNKDDWRRNNVNKLVKRLAEEIKKEKAYVKFGISPFGVWRNFNKDTRGSMTTAGQTNYDDLFADILYWQENKWVDYIMPQLYWENGHKAADYETLLNWWNDNAFERHIYIGHGLYRLGSNSKWQNMNEITTQVNQLRTKNNVQGSCYYSAKFFLKNTYNLVYVFQNEIYPTPALLPEMKWIRSEKPLAPELKIQHAKDGNKIISWSKNKDENLQYAVYSFDKNQKKLIAITRDNFYIQKSNSNQSIAVTALNRLHNESGMSNKVN
ncbi:MAG: family 10 glycosylhydrolase [Chitinophagaceae bacterium]|nr:family 10 glycosylhydrolase [Chitinophagaceae bacterium]